MKKQREQSSTGPKATVQLTPEEVADRGLELAQVTAMLDELKSEKQLINKLYGDWEKELQARKRDLSLAIRHGLEERDDERQREFFETLKAAAEKRTPTTMPEALKQARQRAKDRAEQEMAEREAEERGGGRA